MSSAAYAESWTWYGVASFVVLCRFAARSILLGSPKRLQLEDYVMAVTFAFYTALTVSINISIRHPQTNILAGVPPESLTPENIRLRIYGSKFALVTEQCMVMTQWGTKAALLMMYYKLTSGLREQLYVKLLAGYIATTWLVLEICFFAVWCRPFTQYWAVPANNVQCTNAAHHLIMSACFNITADILLILIPLPIFIRSQLPLRKKIALCAVFSLGIFVILSAVLNKYYSFAHPDAPNWIFWYIREASTAVLVTNIPCCWPLLRHAVALSGLDSRKTPLEPDSKNSQPSSAKTKATELSMWGGSSKKGAEPRSESMEDITGKDRPLEIWQHREFRIEDPEAQSQQSEAWEGSQGKYNPTGLSDDYKTRSTVTAGAFLTDHVHAV